MFTRPPSHHPRAPMPLPQPQDLILTFDFSDGTEGVDVVVEKLASPKENKQSETALYRHFEKEKKESWKEYFVRFFRNDLPGSFADVRLFLNLELARKANPTWTGTKRSVEMLETMRITKTTNKYGRRLERKKRKKLIQQELERLKTADEKRRAEIGLNNLFEDEAIKEVNLLLATLKIDK